MASSACTVLRAVAVFSCVFAIVLVSDVQAACSLNDLAPCLTAVTKDDMPTPSCCQKVAAVDVRCFCNLVKNGKYPPTYINNAVKVPTKCGGAAYKHFKGQVCAGHRVD